MASLLVKKTRGEKFVLLVSIPRNHFDMAKAAEAAGADAVKVHINCVHPASGHLFGSLKKERKNLEAVVKSLSIPAGIVPGADRVASASELENLREMGFDFFDVFAHHMPLDYLKVEMGRMVCIDSRYSAEQVRHLASCGVEVFEASVIPHDGYGKPVVFSDLAVWRSLAERLDVPLLVSTQRKIRPEECVLLRQAGVKGVVIGVVVTGETTKRVYETTRLFRQSIEKL